jgi:hypothetical protein
VDAGIQAVGELVGVPAERAHEVTVASVEADDDVVQGRPNVVVVGEDALEHHSPGSLCSNPPDRARAGHHRVDYRDPLGRG